MMHPSYSKSSLTAVKENAKLFSAVFKFLLYVVVVIIIIIINELPRLRLSGLLPSFFWLVTENLEWYF
jgi:hypothetical protein